MSQQDPPFVWCPPCREYREPEHVHPKPVPKRGSSVAHALFLAFSLVFVFASLGYVGGKLFLSDTPSSGWEKGFTQAFGTVPGSTVSVDVQQVGGHRVAIVYGEFPADTKQEAVESVVLSWPQPRSVFEVSEVDVLVLVLRVTGAAEVTFSFTRAGELGVPTPEAKPSITAPKVGGIGG